MEEYIESFDGITRERLEVVYKHIKKLLPDAKEKISYGVPTFYNDNGYIVYFAGYKDFISLYPVHQAETLKEELVPYMYGRSTARFYNNKELPVTVITDIVLELEKNNKARKGMK